MYKLLIVDDEKLIREGLVNYIDWSALEIEVVGTAANGQSALEQIQGKNPDIVLSDIKMPTMDGIELLKTLRERNIKSEIIFISAYGNFEYAQNAVKYGAFDYILKPIEENALTDTVRRCIARLEENNCKESALKDLKEDRTKRTEQIYRELLLGKAELTPADRELLRQSGIAPDAFTHMAVTVVRFQSEEGPDTAGRTSGLLPALEKRLVSPIPDVTPVILPISARETAVILLSTIGKALLEERLTTLAEGFVQDCTGKNWLTTVSLSEVHETGTELNRLYVEASVAVLSGEYGNRSPLRRFSQVRELAGIKEGTQIMTSKLLSLVKTGDKSELQNFLSDMLLIHINTDAIYDIEVLKMEYSKVLDFVLENLPEYAARLAAGGLNSSLSFKKVIGRQTTILQIHETANRILFNLIDLNRELPAGSNKNLIGLALDYIHGHYSRDFSLQDVANELYISPSYLSKIFSEEVKESFSRYLIKYRIRKAKELLKDHRYKVYEIAALVGYTDVCHFTKIFKELEGVTPKKYREL